MIKFEKHVCQRVFIESQTVGDSTNFDVSWMCIAMLTKSGLREVLTKHWPILSKLFESAIHSLSIKKYAHIDITESCMKCLMKLLTKMYKMSWK